MAEHCCWNPLIIKLAADVASSQDSQTNDRKRFIVTICPVCLVGETLPYSEQQWSVWGDGYRLHSCEACHSISTFPLPSNDVLSRLYAESFDYRWYQDHYWAKLRDCRERIREYQSFLGRKVLDFGGGVGYMSAALREAGYESVTYDPFCREDDKVEGNWDTVIALHVLEHANDPDHTIAQMKSMLSSSGKLIVAVPNAGGIGYRELGMSWVWAQPPVLHILHFTSEGLITILERNGFKVEDVRYSERWDANLYCDFEQVGRFRKLDALWGRQPYTRFKLYRKFCALLVSAIRYNGLQKVLRGKQQSCVDFSELQIVARMVSS